MGCERPGHKRSINLRLLAKAKNSDRPPLLLFFADSPVCRTPIEQPLVGTWHLTTRALHWERRRPACSERAARIERLEVEDSVRALHLAVLEAGGTPAVPVKSSSGQAQATTKGKPLVEFPAELSLSGSAC